MKKHIGFVERLRQQRPVTIQDVTQQFMEALGHGFPEADTLNVLMPPLLASFLGAANLSTRSGYAMEAQPLVESPETEHVTRIMHDYLRHLGYRPDTTENIIDQVLEAARTWLQDPENIQLLAAAARHGKNSHIQL